MKRFFYHGTSADNLQSILKYGISAKESKLWSCSQDEVYLWCPLAAAKADGYEDESEDEINERAFHKASESGQIACAAANDCRVVVIKVLIDDNELMADNSCENMEGSGAVCVGRDITPDEIVEIKISNDLGMLKGYFIGMIIDRDYCNLEFDQLETQVAKAFTQNSVFIDELNYLIEWETVNELENA